MHPADLRAQVLVVEDDADIRESLQDVLGEEGYRVAGAANGREALGFLRDGRPALILLDLMMPVMDGWAFRAEQAQDVALSQIPVIILSADMELPRKAGRLGTAGYLRKPVDLDELLRTVARYVPQP